MLAKYFQFRRSVEDVTLNVCRYLKNISGAYDLEGSLTNNVGHIGMSLL